MRDMRKIRQDTPLLLKRASVIWVTLGVVILLGMSFGMGYVIGQRSEKLTSQMTNDSHSLEQLAKQSRRHRELTFYNDLARRQKQEEAKNAEAAAPAAAPAPKKEKKEPAPQEEAATPEATPAKPVRAALDLGPAKPGEFTIQVSSYQTREEAKAYSAALERKGFHPFVVAATLNDKGTWYRVRLGRFQSEDDAIEAKLLLAQADIPAWVLRTE
jgi:cell division protein FtsN